MENKLELISRFFSDKKSVAIAVSGGVDSAVLLSLAKACGVQIKAYYVKTAFQPCFELEDAKRLCKMLDVELEVIEYDILSNSQIVENSQMRCYYCKRLLFTLITQKAKSDGYDIVCEGTNASDNTAERPGYAALTELGVLSPLRLCGFEKSDIRRLAKERSIFLHSKPSYACLATRVQSTTKITADILKKTEAAENELMTLGFSDFRIRYKNGDALLQLSENDFRLLTDKREKTVASLKKYYKNVMLDLKLRDFDG